MRAGASDPRSDSAAPRRRGRARVVDLVALVLALEERQAMLPSERRARDREVGPALQGLAGIGLLRRWLAVAPSPALALRIQRVTRAFAWIRGGLSLVGFLLGWSAAAALLAIGGPGGRVSIAACLGVLVGLPFASWLASFGLWLLSLAVARLPGSAPGEPARLSDRLLRLMLRLVPASTRLDLEAVLGRARAQAGLYARLQRGQLLCWLTRSGLFFGGGALAATLGFVVFTDLAFGWSTTLDVAPERVHRFVLAIARPWAWLWPAASPSLELVTVTRHFRVTAPSAPGTTPPIVYGAWWPFLVMAIGCYAVLPRLLSLLVVGHWLGRETERAMSLTPGVLELVDALTTPRIESRAEGEEGPVGRALGGMAPEIELRAWLARDRSRSPSAPLVVVWAEAVAEPMLRERLGGDARVFEAGGRRSLADDAAALREAGKTDAAVLVAVRGHEPPVLELLDFLADVRRAVGPARPIGVLLAGGHRQDHATWRLKLASLADPMLVVSALELAHG